MKRLAFFLVGVALAGLMLLPYSANAAITLTPSVEGLGGGTFKPLAIPSLAGNNFAATGKVLVNGKWINIPGYIPPASTAAQAAKTSLFANPWLLGLSLLAWAGDAGLHSDEVGGWMYTDPNGGTGPSVQAGFPVDATIVGCRCASGNCTCDPSMQACAVNYAPLGVSDRYCYAFRSNEKLGVYAGYKQDYYGTPITGAVPAGETPYGSCPSGYSMAPGTTSCDPVVANRPATQDDFNALPAPPPQALAELAPQVGVPVDAPVYEPSTVPVGDPYTKPDGSTAQPMAQISPASNGQVTVDVYEMPLTDPQGNPVNDPQPQDTPEPQPTDCDKYPTSVGCTDLGTPPLGEDMPHTEQPITFTPVPISANATCPAPITVNGFGQTLTIDYSSACTYASGLRPIVIAIGYLTALFIIFGVPRSAQS
jgi:hypothetical protein